MGNNIDKTGRKPPFSYEEADQRNEGNRWHKLSQVFWDKEPLKLTVFTHIQEWLYIKK